MNASRRRFRRSGIVAALFGAGLLAAAPARAAIVHAVEFYNATTKRHHVTALASEIAHLDATAGQPGGWTRTGHTFRAHDRLVNGTNPVCRYWLAPPHGNSHVHSASAAECAQIRAKFPQFVHEADAVMHLAVPDPATGDCGATRQPVYRLWHPGPESQHRYTADAATRDGLVAQGWIAEGYGPDPVSMCAEKSDVEPDPATANLPPPCKGPNSRVAFPSGPHGMYVWNPNPFMTTFLVKDVIGKDPTLCGASLVIPWSAVNPSKGVYDWSSITTAAQPYVSAGLTVNLLFSEASENPNSNTVTPAWVFAPVASGGAGAPSVTCGTNPTMPVYFDPAYEAAWTTFIAAAINEFSHANSALAPNVGYMRFATGGGAEALVPPGVNDNGVCEAAWAAAGWSYAAWNAHEARIITAMGNVPTDKQVMVSIGQAPGGPNIYDVSNQAAAVALSKHVGFSFENLGMGGVAAAGTTPAPCNPQGALAALHWCQAYTNYVGQVPFAMQPITATTNTSVVTMDIGVLLGYALANKIQVFELYPEEWLSASSPDWPGFVAANQAKYRAALDNAAQTLGATNGK